MATDSSRKKSSAKKKSTKKKAAQKKTSTKSKRTAAKKRSAARKKTAAKAAPKKASVKLDEVEGLAKDLELEKPAQEKRAEFKSVPSATVVPDTVSARAGGAVRNRDITNFLRQFIMMLEAGTPILKSLKSLARRGEQKGIRNLVAGIAEYVESGNPLWQAFARESRYFSPVFVNLIKVAEASGTLPAVLRRLADYRDQRERLQRYVQVAMIYPTVLVVVSLVVLIIFSMFVIPAFRDIFNTMDVQLNWYSTFIMNAADFIRHWWWVGVVIIVGLVLLYQFWWIRSPLRQQKTDEFKLRVPIFGRIIQRNVIARFMRTLAMLLRSGISMMATLDLCKNSTGNRAYIGVVQDMRDSVESGEGLEAPLREAEKNGYFPGVVVDMLLTGEETGSLEQVADQIAETYEEEVEIAVNGLKETITPVFVVLMGFIVASIFIGMFLPLIAMIQSISSGAL